jgi:ATP-dependent RNA helicase DDX56/DBP9
MDLDYLRHDKPLHPTRVQSHMKHIPKYLLPRVAAVPDTSEVEGSPDKGAGFIPFKKTGRGGKSGNRGRGGSRHRGTGRKKADPLKKFGR